MTIAVRQVNPAGTRVFMGTLTGGVALHPALAEVAVRLGVQTATVELLGGLAEAHFTETDFASGQKKAPLIFRRHLEIVAGHGTISLLDGAPHIHFHLALSFQDAAAPHGIAVVGGHCAHAVCHAVEFTLTSYEGAPVSRALYAATGLRLWDIPTMSEE